MLLRSFAVFVVGAAVLAGILYYASTVDSRPPGVTSFTLSQHLSGDTAVALTSTSLEIHFSEPVDKPEAEAAFRIEPAVDGSYSWTDSTLTFTPLQPLPPKTDFTAHIEPGVRDSAGNEMQQASAAFGFTTVGEPQVVDSDPAANATDVPLDASIRITFSTLMDTRSVGNRARAFAGRRLRPALERRAADDRATRAAGGRPALRRDHQPGCARPRRLVA